MYMILCGLGRALGPSAKATRATMAMDVVGDGDGAGDGAGANDSDDDGDGVGSDGDGAGDPLCSWRTGAPNMNIPSPSQ